MGTPAPCLKDPIARDAQWCRLRHSATIRRYAPNSMRLHIWKMDINIVRRIAKLPHALYDHTNRPPHLGR